MMVKFRKTKFVLTVFILFFVFNIPKIINFLFPYPTVPFVSFLDMLDYLLSFVPFMATKNFDYCLKKRATAVHNSTTDRLYKYLMAPSKKCPEDIEIVWLIKSSVYRNDLRLTLRHTWVQNVSRTFVHLFLVGKAVDDDGDNDDPINGPLWTLEKEQIAYNDILQGDFVDSFLSTADKVVMGLDYVRHECPRAKYYVIADDDSVVLPWNLWPYLVELRNQNRTVPLYTGYVYGNRRPIHNPSSRWHVPKSLYKCNTYPDYVGGQLIAMNYEAFTKIYELCRQLQPLTMDDIYLATLARVAGIKATTLIHKRQHAECSDLTVIHHSGFELYKNLIVCHGADESSVQRRLWTEMCYSSVSRNSDRKLLNLFC